MEQITILNAANEPKGPFTRAEVIERIQTGEFTLGSLAFMEGLTEWTPLRDVFARIDGPTPAPDRSTVAVAAPAAAPVRNRLVYSYAATMEPPTHLVYAGFWKRAAAILIDLLILSPLTIISFVLEASMSPSIPRSAESAGFSTSAIALVLFSGFSFVIRWLYFALLESGAWQATIGKRVLGIRVTSLDGKRISFGRATGRYFGKIVSGIILCIGFIMAAFTERKQALHDMLAGTLVVRS